MLIGALDVRSCVYNPAGADLSLSSPCAGGTALASPSDGFGAILSALSLQLIEVILILAQARHGFSHFNFHLFVKICFPSHLF